MPRKVTFTLLALFALFLIWNDATGTGESANTFFDWLGTGFDRGTDFISSVFGDEETVSS